MVLGEGAYGLLRVCIEDEEGCTLTAQAGGRPLCVRPLEKVLWPRLPGEGVYEECISWGSWEWGGRILGTVSRETALNLDPAYTDSLKSAPAFGHFSVTLFLHLQNNIALYSSKVMSGAGGGAGVAQCIVESW